jgi:chitinase
MYKQQEQGAATIVVRGSNNSSQQLQVQTLEVVSATSSGRQRLVPTAPVFSYCISFGNYIPSCTSIHAQIDVAAFSLTRKTKTRETVRSRTTT